MSFFESMTTIGNLIRNTVGLDEKMGAARMAELLPEALDVKYNDGYSVGHTDGYDSGETDGLAQGEEIGYKGGRKALFNVLQRKATELTPTDLEGMTELWGYAFYNYTNLKRIELPYGVTTIKGAAFRGCAGLSEVVLPDSLTIIAASAFRSCTSLTEMTIPKNVREIRDYTFEYCPSLNKIILPEDTKSIGVSAFQGCTSLTEMTIPKKVTNIESYALHIGSATDKATITFLSNTPPTIQSNTFGSTRLEKIIVPIMCGDVFCEATNWSAIADYIVEMFYMGSSDVTFGEGISTVEMDVEMTSVGRYLVIDVKCDLDLSDEDNSVAFLDGFTIGSYVEIGSTISVGRNVIDLYKKFTEEEVRAWLGSKLPIQFDFAAYADLEDKIPYNCRFSFYLSEVEPE